jgi:hypothetical protein
VKGQPDPGADPTTAAIHRLDRFFHLGNPMMIIKKTAELAKLIIIYFYIISADSSYLF